MSTERRDKIKRKLSAYCNHYVEQVYELGRVVGYSQKLLYSDVPVCQCDKWDTGRTLGFIRKTVAGFALIGWRGTKERLEEPEALMVNESLFNWCPWCGGKVRKS